MRRALRGAALFSAAEPDICGALPLCIRVMILAEKDIRPRHVYLRRAAALRRDRARFSVALDGPSGSGKSTAAKQLAKELDILYLDTGAMYRACAVKAQRAGVAEFTEESVAPLMASLDLRVDYVGGAQRTILDGEDVSEAIRRPEVSLAASRISALRCVRKKDGRNAAQDRFRALLRAGWTAATSAPSCCPPPISSSSSPPPSTCARSAAMTS